MKKDVGSSQSVNLWMIFSQETSDWVMDGYDDDDDEILDKRDGKGKKKMK